MRRNFNCAMGTEKRCTVLNLKTNEVFDVHSLGDVGKANGSFKCDAVMKVDGEEPVTWYVSMKYGGGYCVFKIN